MVRGTLCAADPFLAVSPVGDQNPPQPAVAAQLEPEFIALGRKKERTAEEEQRLAFLKQEMADRLLAAPADAVYEVCGDAAIA